MLENLYPNWTPLLRAEKLAHASKWGRWMRSPLTYPLAILFSYFIYPLTKMEWRKKVSTFFGVPMTTLLPSGTDLWLNGIKSHDSEIRLSKFLTRHLKPGATFIDIGAHYGYYSLLASTLAGKNGEIFSIEASQHSFDILQANVSMHDNITIYHHAAGDRHGEIVFYEYPGPYAEYNTMVKGQYEGAAWRKKVKETLTRVGTILLDDLIREHGIQKAILKIDVEGGELNVLRGASQSLKNGDLTIVMEYLFSSDPESPHHQAVDFLKQNGYTAFNINREGEVERVNDIDTYLKHEKLDSDNLVFAVLPPGSFPL